MFETLSGGGRVNRVRIESNRIQSNPIELRSCLFFAAHASQLGSHLMKGKTHAKLAAKTSDTVARMSTCFGTISLRATDQDSRR